jgi:isoquinoline 1-oxidoreductase alpha subunit
MKLTLNGQERVLEGFDPDMPLSWAIRDMAGLTGTKFGCGRAFCGACTVHLDDKPVRSCSFPASAAAGREVTTIEGVSGPVARAVLVGWAWSPGGNRGARARDAAGNRRIDQVLGAGCARGVVRA